MTWREYTFLGLTYQFVTIALHLIYFKKSPFSPDNKLIFATALSKALANSETA